MRSAATLPYGPRAFDEQRAAVHQMHAAVDVELVALGVAAEVVVIVEYQHAAARRAGAEEMRGCQSADAGADDDEVERLAGLGDRSVERTRIAQCVRCFERARVTAAHAETLRRVVAGAILLGELGGCGDELRCKSAEQHAADADRRALQEVASCDRLVHAEFFVGAGRHGVLWPMATDVPESRSPVGGVQAGQTTMARLSSNRLSLPSLATPSRQRAS